MRKFHIVLLASGASCLAVNLYLRQPFGFFGFALPIMLISASIRGIWADHQRAEKYSGIYTHQRSGVEKAKPHYHEL